VSKPAGSIVPGQILQWDAELVQFADAAFADAARRSGPHLVCRPGCTQCCHGVFAINALDALRLRHAMREMADSHPALSAAIQERARRFLHDYGGSFPGNPATGILATGEAAEEAFAEWADDAACPALDPATGLCDVYAARPMTCRVFGPPVRAAENGEDGLAVCELCFTQATEAEIAAAEMHIPNQEEAALLEALPAQPGEVGNPAEIETIVAYCLLDAVGTATGSLQGATAS